MGSDDWIIGALIAVVLASIALMFIPDFSLNLGAIR